MNHSHPPVDGPRPSRRARPRTRRPPGPRGTARPRQPWGRETWPAAARGPGGGSAVRAPRRRRRSGGHLPPPSPPPAPPRTVRRPRGVPPSRRRRAGPDPKVSSAAVHVSRVPPHSSASPTGCPCWNHCPRPSSQTKATCWPRRARERQGRPVATGGRRELEDDLTSFLRETESGVSAPGSASHTMRWRCAGAGDGGSSQASNESPETPERRETSEAPCPGASKRPRSMTIRPCPSVKARPRATSR